MDLDRARFQALRDNYPALVPKIQEALFSLLAPSLLEPSWEGPNPASPTDLWLMLTLDGIFINPDRAELLFGFSGDVWPDVMFSVSVDGMLVKPIALDD